MLRELAREADKDEKELARDIGIDPRTAKKVLEDGDWELSRGKLEKLMLYAVRHGYPNGIFLIEPDPLWRSFQKRTDTVVYRGPHGYDTDAETNITQHLQLMNGNRETRMETGRRGKSDEIAKAMKSRNCIFVGSPKHNAATEIALALLCGAEPFDTKARNRERFPVQVLGMEPADAKASAVLTAGARHGFDVIPPDDPKRHFIRMDWRPKKDYDSWHGTAWDVAVIGICHAPLGTSENVTTIIIMGYTGLATLVATQQLTQQFTQADRTYPQLTEEEAPFTEGQLAEAGKLHLAAFRFKFTKSSSRSHTDARDRRKPVKDSGKWLPPWTDSD